MEKGGAGGGPQVHTGRGLTGGAYQAETAGPSWRDREQRGNGVREMGNVQVYRRTLSISRMVGGSGDRWRKEVQGRHN